MTGRHPSVRLYTRASQSTTGQSASDNENRYDR